MSIACLDLIFQSSDSEVMEGVLDLNLGCPSPWAYAWEQQVCPLGPLVFSSMKWNY